MGFFDNFPYTNFHQLNLDWILRTLRELRGKTEQFDESINTATAKAEQARNSAEEARSFSESSLYYSQVAEALTKSGKRYILIGDSYLVGYTPEGTVTNWGLYFRQLTGLPASATYIFAEGSSGFTKPGNDGHTFRTLLESRAAEVVNPESITNIIVLGGFNDYLNPGGIVGAISEFAISAKTFFPNCKISVGFIGRFCGTDNDYANDLYTAYYNYKLNTSVAYINGIEYCCRNINQFSSDGIHPNEVGQLAIAMGLLDYAAGGSPRNWLAPLTATGAQIVNYTTNNGETVSIDVGGGIYTLESLAGEDANGASIDLGLITGGCLCTTVLNSSFSVPCFCYTAGGWVPGIVSFTVNRERHLIANFVVHGSDTVSRDGQVHIVQNGCTFPTMRC